MSILPVVVTLDLMFWLSEYTGLHINASVYIRPVTDRPLQRPQELGRDKAVFGIYLETCGYGALGFSSMADNLSLAAVGWKFAPSTSPAEKHQMQPVRGGGTSPMASSRIYEKQNPCSTSNVMGQSAWAGFSWLRSS